MSLEGKIAFVTGATRGIGNAIALELAAQGAYVIGTSTSEVGAEKITTAFKEAGVKGEGCVLDVCNEDQVTDVIKHITDTHGAIAVLVNNAGITKDNLFMRMKPEQWNDVINTNLNAIYRITKACIRPMLKARWGRVINISSVVGVSGNPGQANYCAAKAGVIGFSKSLAQEIAGYGITINVVAPGFIDTDMTRNLDDKQREMIHTLIPMKRVGQPQEIADTVAFLASDKATYITGQTLHVNGGMCMV